MGPLRRDPRLRTLPAVACGACGRVAARATGDLEPLGAEWATRLLCDACGRSTLVRPAEDDWMRRIVREAPYVYDQPDVAGEIVDGAPSRPRAEAPDLACPPFLRIEDHASSPARALRRPFAFTAAEDGTLRHAPAGKARHHRSVRAVEQAAILAPLRALLERAELPALPPTVGRGDRRLAVSLGDVTRTLQWREQDGAPDLGDDPHAGPAVVDLVRGLDNLIAWVDHCSHVVGGNAPPQAFPGPERLLRGVRTVRRTGSSSDDGGAASAVAELWVDETGVFEACVRGQGLAPRVVHDPEAARRVIDRVVALDPPRLRRALGYVRYECDLERTHEETLEWFDGRRVHRTHFLYGSERSVGTGYGDTPPSEREREALDLLPDAFRGLPPEA